MPESSSTGCETPPSSGTRISRKLRDWNSPSGCALLLGQIENFGAFGIEPQNIRRALNSRYEFGSRRIILLAKNAKRAFAIGDIQNGLPVGRPFIRTALTLVQSEALQLANFARPRVHLRHENGRSDVRANEHCVLSVGRHINDGFPVRAAGEAHGRSPAPSGPRVYFQRPHVGLALVGRLLGTREKKPIVARPDQAVLQAVVVED